MKITKRILLFALLIVAASWLIACEGANDSSSDSANTSSSGTNFPPVPSGIAEAPIEMVDSSMSKLSDHKGKVLVVNLWGIWCGPCRAEMPELEKMRVKYEGQDLEILGLNIGTYSGTPEPVDKIIEFGGQMRVNYPLARITPDITRQYYRVSRQEAVPQTFIIDREGRLRGVFVGGGQRTVAAIFKSVDALMSE